MLRTIRVFLTAMVLPACLHAQAQGGRQLPPAPSYTVSAAQAPIKVDGRLDDAGWRGSADIPVAWEYTPGDNITPPVRTLCHLTFDASNLYIGCRAWDPRPREIRAHLMDRDDVDRLAYDDHIMVMIDPFNDQRRGFQFRVNARGVQADAVNSTEAEDWSWDAIWASAATVDTAGYSVEIAIPFRSLRFPQSSEVQTWGFIIERSWPRLVRHRIQSAPNDRNNTCGLCQANKVTGFQGIAPGRNVEVTPTVTGIRTDERADFPSGSIVNGKVEPSVGADLRWGITPNVSFNGTVNPDFSQVEADVAQLNVNTRFALFYPEKRPFFLEGADFFGTPIDAVFTRTIADPDAGLKLTGKVGKAAVGIFGAADALTNLLFPSNQRTDATTLEQESYGLVGRFREDIGQASYVGGLYSGRFGNGYMNQVGGADIYQQISRSANFRIQYLASLTEYPDSVATAYAQPSGQFRGGALSTQVGFFNAKWNIFGRYADYSPNFRADLGFVPRVDTRDNSAEVNRIWRRDRGWYSLIRLGTGLYQTRDHTGQLTDQNTGMGLVYSGPLQSTVLLRGKAIQERFAGVLYKYPSFDVSVSLQPRSGFSLGASATFGDAVDYTNNRQSQQTLFGPSAVLSLGNHLSLSLSDNFQRLTYQGNEVFRANLVQSRIFYYFNTRALLRAVIQYQEVRRDPAQYTVPVNETDRGLFGQLLFSYKVNPLTVLFLGYSENSLGTQDYDLTQRNRTFFLKLGYAWRP
jgi:hypothetical protein